MLEALETMSKRNMSMPNTAALTTRLLLGAAMALTAALASAQPVYRAAPAGPLAVDVRHDGRHMHRPPPPPPRYERHSRARSGHAWVGGHWRWQGQRYVWIPGYWAKAPRHHRPHPGPYYGHR